MYICVKISSIQNIEFSERFLSDNFLRRSVLRKFELRLKILRSDRKTEFSIFFFTIIRYAYIMCILTHSLLHFHTDMSTYIQLTTWH